MAPTCCCSAQRTGCRPSRSAEEACHAAHQGNRPDRAVRVVLGRCRRPPLVISTNNTPQDRKALELPLREAFRRAGLDFRLVGNPFGTFAAPGQPGRGRWRGLRIAGLDAQYPNLIQVPERFIGISFVAFARDAMINVDRSWESLKPYRVPSSPAGRCSRPMPATPERDQGRQAGTDVPHARRGQVDLALYTKADGIALIRSPSACRRSPDLAIAQGCRHVSLPEQEA